MNATLGLFLLTAAFAAFAVLFTLPKLMMGVFARAYPYIAGVFALAYLVGFALTPYVLDKLLCALMLIVCAVAIENRLGREAKSDMRALYQA